MASRTTADPQSSHRFASWVSGFAYRPQVAAEQHALAKYFLELCMVDYEMVHIPPSKVASAALSLSLRVFDCGDWVRPYRHTALYSLVGSVLIP